MTQTNATLPRGLKLAAGYFLLIGGLGLIWPFLGLGPSYPEFEAKSLAYKFGAYTREGALDVAFIVVGASVLRRRSWAPIVAYILLAIATVYSGYQFAWGLASGQPNGVAIIGSFVVVGAWNALWAYLVYRNRAHLAGSQHVEPVA